MYNMQLTYEATGNNTNGLQAALSRELAMVEHIRAWLVSKVAELLSVAPEALDEQEPLGNFGLSSMTGLMLSGDIEEWLGLTIDPAVVWEYPTIETLAHYLSQEVLTQQAAR